MSRRVVAALGLLVGCNYNPSRSGTTDAPPDPALCFGATGNFEICVPALPPAPLTIEAPTVIDTDTDADCDAVVIKSDVPELCVVSGTTITISSVLGARGARPLVLLATDAFIQSGLIDVGSHRDTARLGPGANATACTASTAGEDSGGGGGGGAGGSFGSTGGAGATGQNGAVAGGVAGPAIGEPQAFVRGGCSGGNGGRGGVDATGGKGGDGGGAVYIVSGGAIQLSGAVNASGAGATASPKPAQSMGNGGGAGGGGSGGMIALFAETTLEFNGRLIANGGGGAEGGDKPNNCDPGDDPAVATLDGGLRGSGICNAGGDGGDGAGNAPAFAGTAANEGGGGGGGGHGVIRVLSGQSIVGLISPPPS